MLLVSIGAGAIRLSFYMSILLAILFLIFYFRDNDPDWRVYLLFYIGFVLLHRIRKKK